MSQITSYDVIWHFESHSGTLQVNTDAGVGHAVHVDNPEEMALLVHLLRSEVVVYFEEETRSIQTRLKPIQPGLPNP